MLMFSTTTVTVVCIISIFRSLIKLIILQEYIYLRYWSKQAQGTQPATSAWWHTEEEHCECGRPRVRYVWISLQSRQCCARGKEVFAPVGVLSVTHARCQANKGKSAVTSNQNSFELPTLLTWKTCRFIHICSIFRDKWNNVVNLNGWGCERGFFF